MAAHAAEDLLFVDLFRQYGVEPVLAVDTDGRRLSGRFILDTIGKPGNKLIYVSGPEPMVETLNADLEKLGAAKNQLVGDFFPGYEVI